MQHISTTPFGRRPVTAGLLAAQALAREAEADRPAADKWQILRDLGLARVALGVTDRDLAVLAALVSFHQAAAIEASGCIVFPSNAALSQRAHGMAESTLRRHLAALVGAGLILRHDSPNGKRYAVRGLDADLDRAFGFDLAPLARRVDEISALAREAELAVARLHRLRETVVLRLRDCAKLVDYGMAELPGNWDALSDEVALTRRALRRKLDQAGLRALDAQVAGLLARITAMLQQPGTEETGGNAVDSGRHIQDSTIIPPDSEPCPEKARAAAVAAETQPQLPLHLVLRACPEILLYARDGIRDWWDLVAAAAFVRGMMGISADAWDEAQFHMTPPVAAIVVACILQSVERIAKPGGYLRALSRKAAEGAFSPGPMVMALLRTGSSQAA